MVILAFISTGCQQKQTVIVAPSDGIKTKIYAFEDRKLAYQFEANVGRNGIAKLNEKREGDGKTPSGVYKIGKVFAYEQLKVDMPFVKADKNMVCVDDSKSRYYNQVIDASAAIRDWESFEYMKRDDHQYRFGAIVEYNSNNEAGIGSCIFIHIKKDANSPTAGCVALDEVDMKKLIFWLKHGADPLIKVVQDRGEFAKIMQEFSLTD